jgi:hypothetical protein
VRALKAARKRVLCWQITCFTSTKVQTLTREERRGRSGGGGGSRVFGRRLAQGSLPQARAPQARPILVKLVVKLVKQRWRSLQQRGGAEGWLKAVCR